MTAFKDIDELFINAQLISRDTNEAARLVEKAVELRVNGNQDPAAKLIDQVNDQGVQRSQPDILSDRLLVDELDRAVPKVFSRMSGKRRIAVRDAFLTHSDDSSERAVFLISVRRAIEENVPSGRASSVGEHDVASALENYLERVLAPTPIALKSVLESRYPEITQAGEADGADLKKSGKPSLPMRIAGAFLLILVASAIGTWIAFPSENGAVAENAHLFDVIAEHEPAENLTFLGSESSQIERFILDRLDRRVSVPELSDGNIIGVSVETVLPGFQLPAIRYSDLVSSQELLIYVLDYELISHIESRLDVDLNILNQIAAEDAFDIQIDNRGERLIFRERDDIYLALTESGAMDLNERLVFE